MPTAKKSGSAGIEVDASVLLKKLRKLDAEAASQLGKAVRPIVAKVRNEVRDAMPKRTGTARSAIKSGFTAGAAYVKMEKAGKFVYVPWLDFGGTLTPKGGRHNTIRRDRPGKDGRWLYPIAKSKADETKVALQHEWNKTVASVGLDG